MERTIEVDLLRIIAGHNDLFGGIAWGDEDRIRRTITDTLPVRVGDNSVFRSPREYSTRPNARIEPDRVLRSIEPEGINDETELLKPYQYNRGSQGWLGGVVFRPVYGGRRP